MSEKLGHCSLNDLDKLVPKPTNYKWMVKLGEIV